MTAPKQPTCGECKNYKPANPALTPFSVGLHRAGAGTCFLDGAIGCVRGKDPAPTNDKGETICFERKD